MDALKQFVFDVDEALEDLTNGVFGVDVLPDFAEGELSFSEMLEEGLSPRDAARRLMFANGYAEALSCWSTECDSCEYGESGECPHVG